MHNDYIARELDDFQGDAGHRRALFHELWNLANDPDRHLNSGLASGLACLIEAMEMKAGAHVVHLRGGTGYYPAIVALLPLARDAEAA